MFWDERARLPGETAVEQAAYALYHAERVFVLLGSGFSADSGIAPFRSSEDSEDVAIYSSLEAYRMTRAETFQGDERGDQLRWHQRWREAIARAEPHQGQRALGRIISMSRARYAIATQNVDDLFERACAEVGAREPSAVIWHLHGELDQTRCDRCGWRPLLPRGAAAPLDELKACERCGGAMRPDVVWFGEELDEERLRAAERAAARSQVCLIIGTSAVVEPAASLARRAKEQGARLIEINPRESLITPLCDVRIEEQAIKALVDLERALAVEAERRA